MSKGLLPGARFPLPENWEVEDTICVTFVIPDDPEYLATITGLVDELKWSKSFARDETGTGAATVSRTWATALESQPALTQGCDMPEFRIGDDCLLEVNCGTDDEPNWQPVFTAPQPGGEAEVPYPPGTTEYEDDTARCIAAANITAQLKYGTETLANDAAIVGGIAVALIDLLGAFLFFVPGGVLVDIAIAIINLAVGHVAADFSDDLPEIVWDDVRNELACLIERNGVLTEAGRTSFLAWMATQYPGNLAWQLSIIIVQNVNANGLTTDARMPQNDIAIDECETCGCDFEIDFTMTDGGFYAVAPGFDPSHPYGVYSAGNGWANEFDATQGYACNINAIAVVPSGCVITKIEVDMEWNNDYFPFFKVYDPTVGTVFYDEYNAGHGTGLYTYVITGSWSFTDIGIFNRNTNGGAPTNYIKAIRFYA